MQYQITNNDVDGYFHIDVADNMVQDIIRDSIYDDHPDYNMLNFVDNPK